jgi:hypothetical protein
MAFDEMLIALVQAFQVSSGRNAHVFATAAAIALATSEHQVPNAVKIERGKLGELLESVGE